MLKIITAFFLTISVSPLFAQFTTVGNNTYTGNNVGIGTSNPTVALQITKGGTNPSSDYATVQITTTASGSILGPGIYLNGSSGFNGRTWGLVSSGSLDAPATGAAGNFAIYDVQAGSRLVITNTGNVGFSTTSPSSYFHGGNNRVLEIYNNGTSANSQAHLILSTGSVAANSSAGTITWISKGSTGSQGMAYIGSLTEGDAGANASGNLTFATAKNNSPVERMRLTSTGNLLVGQTGQVNPVYKLDVAGSVRANEVVVNTNGADFVFEKNYRLRNLKELDCFIKRNHHLPEIPSAGEMEARGVGIGELNKRLLQKVEELTLYLIKKDKQLRLQDKRIKALERAKSPLLKN